MRRVVEGVPAGGPTLGFPVVEAVEGARRLPRPAAVVQAAQSGTDPPQRLPELNPHRPRGNRLVTLRALLVVGRALFSVSGVRVPVGYGKHQAQFTDRRTGTAVAHADVLLEAEWSRVLDDISEAHVPGKAYGGGSRPSHVRLPASVPAGEAPAGGSWTP